MNNKEITFENIDVKKDKKVYKKIRKLYKSIIKNKKLIKQIKEHTKNKEDENYGIR